MDEFDKEFTEYFMEVGEAQGLDESMIKIISVLFLEPDEISMNDLAKKTGYSLASISNKIKLLEPARIIRRLKRPGTKKVFLYMEKDFIEIMKKQLLVKHESMIKIAKERLPSIIKKYHGKMKTDAQKKKLKIVEDYYRQIERADIIIHQILALLNKN
jgi:DNA-binding transcriptional regulator GbsR (MarR family)